MYHITACLYLTLVMQLPQMNPWPDNQSVLIVDNCRIHHNYALVDLVHSAGFFFGFSYQRDEICSFFLTGCILMYLPSYSPDLNPIEELFSTCMSIFNTDLCSLAHVHAQ